MYSALTSSPFGSNYKISGSNHMVTISTTMPSGLAQNYYQGTLLQILPGGVIDTISIHRNFPMKQPQDWPMIKKYAYKQ